MRSEMLLQIFTL